MRDKGVQQNILYNYPQENARSTSRPQFYLIYKQLDEPQENIQHTLKQQLC